MRHDFQQAPGAPVHICCAFIIGRLCGQWPDHHWHTGNTDRCTCDECRPGWGGEQDDDDVIAQLVDRGFVEMVEENDDSDNP